MKTALITGVTGQDGAYLAQHLLNLGYHVVGTVSLSEIAYTSNLEWLGIQNEVELKPVDLLDYASLDAVVRSVEPDEIYNLAAQSDIGRCYEYPIYTADADAMGVARLLEIIRRCNPEIRLYQASSSAMFDTSYEFQDESTPLKPNSPYAISKTFAHQMCEFYRKAHGLKVSCGIAFNHESPIRPENFVTRKITATLARGERLLLGNDEVRRDWGFAGDYVEAMHLMLQAEPDDFVLATGESTSIREFVGFCGEVLGEVPEYLKDPELYRPAEAGDLRGNAAKAKEVLGWEPKTTTRELAHLMMEADLARYSQKLRANA
jgi:GDPmannose 4,6-dehydratase